MLEVYLWPVGALLFSHLKKVTHTHLLLFITRDSVGRKDSYRAVRMRLHLHAITYHIHHHKWHRGRGDIWHNHNHFLLSAMHPGCLYMWSLAVWDHVDGANAQWPHSSVLQTADLRSICNGSQTICSFFWLSLSRHSFCLNLSTLNEDKGELQS